MLHGRTARAAFAGSGTHSSPPPVRRAHTPGMFAAPNSASIMSSVPARYRGAASGMRSTYQNSGTALSIGVFFSLMIAGLAGTLGPTLTSGLRHQGVPAGVAARIGDLPPVSSLFAAVLGVNPVQHLLTVAHALSGLPAASRRLLTGHRYFPGLIAGPFHHGLVLRAEHLEAEGVREPGRSW